LKGRERMMRKPPAVEGEKIMGKPPLSKGDGGSRKQP